MTDRRPLPDDTDRDGAVLGIDRSWSVEAGAGTGKTTILVGRVLEMVARGMPVERIAAITFTRLAAAELSIRLRDALAAEGARREEAGDGEGAERFRRAEGSLDRASIATIHSFASALLRRFPAEAGVDPRFRSGEEGEADPVFDRAFERWAAETFSSPRGGEVAARLERPLLAGVGVRALREILGELRSSPELVETLREEPPLPDPFPLVAEFRTIRSALEARLAHCSDPADLRRVHLEEGLARSARLPRLADDELLFELLEEDDPIPVSLSGGKKESWAGGAEELAEIRGTLLGLRRAKTEAGSWRDRFDRAAGEWVLGPLRPLLGRFFELFEEEKRREGVLDFGDLLVRARDLLRSDPAVRAEAASSWGALLVDEFQDTDPVQVEIVELLGALGERHDPARLSLFLVGDPKQSIYRFRRADIESYRGAREKLRAEGDEKAAEAALVTNFRSDPAILRFVNALFEPLFRPGGKGSGAARQADWRDLAPDPERSPSESPAVWLLLPEWKEKLDATAARMSEARAIAARIRTIFEAGETVLDRKGGRRPIRWGDFALLLRALSDVDLYEEALRAAAIPFRVEGGKSFYRRQEVAAAIHALRAIESPGEELSILGALRSPLFSIPHGELVAARRKLGRLDPTSPELDSVLPPGDPVGDALRRLARLRRLREERPLAETLGDLLGGSGLREALLLRSDGERAAGNLEALVEAARALAGAEPLSFGETVDRFRRALEEEQEESEIGCEDAGEGMVQLLSIHKSKGLEFPVVFLADLGRKGPNRPRRVVGRLLPDGGRRVELSAGIARSAGYPDAVEAESAAGRAELARLFYVAATRARERLVLSLVGEPGHESLLSLLGEADAGGESLLERLRRGGFETGTIPVPLDTSGPALPSGVEEGNPAEAERLSAEHEAARRNRLRAAARGAASLPPSAGVEAPEELPATELREPDAESPGLAFGSLLHLLLERLPLGLRADDPLVDTVARTLAENEGAPHETSRLAEHARVALGSRAWLRASSSPRPFRELGFTCATGERSVEDGKIDLLFVEGEGLVLVDWKSDAAGWARSSAERRAKHAQQLRAYRASLATLVPAMPVRETILVFTATGEELAIGTEPPRAGSDDGPSPP
jgi:ATP-dependent exoDNAse (exonuclease V) beta subunit